MNPFNNIMKQPKGMDFGMIFKNPRMQQAGMPTSNPTPINQPTAGQGADVGTLGYPPVADAYAPQMSSKLPPIGPPPELMDPLAKNPYARLFDQVKKTETKPAANPWAALLQKKGGWF